MKQLTFITSIKSLFSKCCLNNLKVQSNLHNTSKFREIYTIPQKKKEGEKKIYIHTYPTKKAELNSLLCFKRPNNPEDPTRTAFKIEAIIYIRIGKIYKNKNLISRESRDVHD